MLTLSPSFTKKICLEKLLGYKNNMSQVGTVDDDVPVTSTRQIL